MDGVNSRMYVMEYNRVSSRNALTILIFFQFGKRSLYDIGIWLRKRYAKLLGKLYISDKIFAQSTGVSRTQMSIELVLASLYPPVETVQEWNKDLNWQPIPFFSEPLDQDTVCNSTICRSRILLYSISLTATAGSEVLSTIPRSSDGNHGEHRGSTISHQ